MKVRLSVVAFVLGGLALGCGDTSDTNDAGSGPNNQDGAGTPDGSLGLSSGNGSGSSSGGSSGASSGSGVSSGGSSGVSGSRGSGTGGTGVADASGDQSADVSGDIGGQDVGTAGAKDAGACPSSQPIRGSLCSYSQLGMTCVYHGCRFAPPWDQQICRIMGPGRRAKSTGRYRLVRL
jgi:hypothetical protein